MSFLLACLGMEIALSLVFVGALLAASAYLLSGAFRSVAKDYAHYHWRLLMGSLLVLLIAFWSLPLVVIKDTFSSALAIVRDVHADSLRPAEYRPSSSYFEYFHSSLVRFALFTFIASAIFAWVGHCLTLIFLRRRR